MCFASRHTDHLFAWLRFQPFPNMLKFSWRFKLKTYQIIDIMPLHDAACGFVEDSTNLGKGFVYCGSLLDKGSELHLLVPRHAMQVEA